MNAMTETKPMFEIGKTYKTRSGRKAKVIYLTDNRLIGIDLDDNSAEDWRFNGQYESRAGSGMDLLPGAIEDEKPDIDVIAGMAAKIDELENRAANTSISNARMISKIDESAQHIGTLQQMVRLLMDKVEAQGGQISDLFSQIRKQRLQLRGDLPIDAGITKDHWKPTQEMVDRAVAMSSPPKRTIKGGWLNVYRGDHMPWHVDREEADEAASPSRIACIQIPAITEGEGL